MTYEQSGLHLPFLRPIEDLLCDPGVTEVMGQRRRRAHVRRTQPPAGVRSRCVLESWNVTVAIKNIARTCGDGISGMQPLLDVASRRLPWCRDVPAFAVAGRALTIRKFTCRYSFEDLVTVWRHHARCRDQLTHITDIAWRRTTTSAKAVLDMRLAPSLSFTAADTV